jgi:hypothetical protein
MPGWPRHAQARRQPDDRQLLAAGGSPPFTNATADRGRTRDRQHRRCGSAGAERRGELGFVEGEVDEPALAHWWSGVTDGAGRPRGHGTGRRGLAAQARWIVREQDRARSTFEETLRTRGFDPAQLTIAMTLPSNEAVRTAVEAGAGVAALSRLVVARALNGDLVELPLGCPTGLSTRCATRNATAPARPTR